MGQSGIKLSNKSEDAADDMKGKIDFYSVKRKRRSKNEVEGRSFVCECGKSYLSQPALTNHKKTKHESDKNTEKRGRGRPKKNVVSNIDMIQKAEIKFKTFFEKDSRRKGSDLIELKLSHVEQAFNELVLPFKDKFARSYNTLEDHPLLRFIKTRLCASENGNEKEGAKNVDEIMYEYLKDISAKANESYFMFVFKFVVLFRECINRFRTVETPEKEFCEVQGADSAPDLCNEFIIDFMEVNNYFGLNTEDQKNEFIEIIQHFCLWLYEHGHTSSRLTLLI